MTFFSVFDLKNPSKIFFEFLPAFFSFFHTVGWLFMMLEVIGGGSFKDVFEVFLENDDVG